MALLQTPAAGIVNHVEDHAQAHTKLNAYVDAVADKYCKGDGSDDAAGLLAAGEDAIADRLPLVLTPNKTFHLASQQVTFDAPDFFKWAVYGYGAEITTEGARSGLKITGGSTNGGVSFYGVKINHRGNTDATYGFEQETTWNARFHDCGVEAHGVGASYAGWSLAQSDPADEDTGCFWTVLNGCWVRKRSGSDVGDIPVGVLLRGSANATRIINCGFNNVTKGIHHTIHSGQTYLANRVLVFGSAFQAYGTAYHLEGAATSNISGPRLIANGFENGTTVFSLTGTTQQPSRQPTLAFNELAADAGTYLNNPNGLNVASLDTMVTPSIVGAGMSWQQPTTIRSLTSADHPLTVQPLGGNRGYRLLNDTGTAIATFVWTGSGNKAQLQAVTGGVANLGLAGIQSISGSTSATTGSNLRGSTTFTSTATKVVAFGTAEPDANYHVIVTGNVLETFSVTAKATTGFTINSDNASSTAVVDWVLIR